MASDNKDIRALDELLNEVGTHRNSTDLKKPVEPVVELASGVEHEADFGDALAEPGFAACVALTDQFALAATHEVASMFTRPTGS